MLVMGPKKIIQNIVQQANIKLENRFRDWGDIFKNLNLIYEDEFPDPQSKPKYVDICDMFHKMDPVAAERLLQLSVFRIYAVPIEQTLDQFAEELETDGELVILNAQEEKVFDGLQSIQPEISKRIRVNKSTKSSYNKYIQFLQKHTQDYYYIVGIETCSLGASLGGWHNCDLTFPGGYSDAKDTLQCAINIAQRETAILFGHVCDYYIQKNLRHGVPGLEDLPLFVESKNGFRKYIVLLSNQMIINSHCQESQYNIDLKNSEDMQTRREETSKSVDTSTHSAPIGTAATTVDQTNIVDCDFMQRFQDLNFMDRMNKYP